MAGKDFPLDMERIIEMELGLTIEPITDLQRELDVDAFLKRDFSGIGGWGFSTCTKHLSYSRLTDPSFTSHALDLFKDEQ